VTSLSIRFESALAERVSLKYLSCFVAAIVSNSLTSSLYSLTSAY